MSNFYTLFSIHFEILYKYDNKGLLFKYKKVI